MTDNVIYHNSRCSKSRSALDLIESRGIDIKVVDYQQQPPRTEDLEYICQQLGISPLELIRTKDKKFLELKISPDIERSDQTWIQLICDHPQILERPIVVYKGKVAIGRPPENILSIF